MDAEIDWRPYVSDEIRVALLLLGNPVRSPAPGRHSLQRQRQRDSCFRIHLTGYTKLFGTILDSTIWREAKETKILWITMLAMAGREGIVEAAVPGLADRAKLTLQETETALACLLKPDPYSRTKEFDGRRIEAIEGGWKILNHSKYRLKMSAEDRAEYQRQYMADYRAKGRDKTRSGKLLVNTGKQKLARLGHSEAEAEAEADPEAEASYNHYGFRGNRIPTTEHQAAEWASMGGVPPDFARELFHQCEGRGWVDGAGQRIVCWRSYSAQRWVKRQAHKAEGGGGNGERKLTPLDIKTIIQAKQASASELKQKYSSEAAMGTTWNDQKAKTAFFALKREIKDLNQKLGSMA